jgi:hypothetical protein
MSKNYLDGTDNLGKRLDGWGEIASYLNRDIRTVQRWEKLQRLPIHRDAGARARVWAFSSELDKWLEEQDASRSVVASSIAAADPAIADVEHSARPRILRLMFVSVTVASVVFTGLWLHKATPTPLRFVPDRIFARVDAEGGKAPFLALPGHPFRLGISSAGDEIYILDNSGRRGIDVIDVDPLRLTETIKTPGGATSLAVASAARKLYIGTHSGELGIADRKTNSVRMVPEKLPGEIRDLALSRDEKRLYLAVYRAGLRRYDVETGQFTILSSTGCAESLALDDRHNKLFVGYKCGGIGGSPAHDTVDMLDLNSGERSVAFRGPPMVAGSLVLSPNTDQLWVDGLDACQNPEYRKYDLTGCPGFPANIHHVFRPSDHTLIKTISAVAPEISLAPAFTPDGTRVVVPGLPVRVMETGTYNELERFERENLEFSTPPVWDLRRERLYLATLNPGRIYSIDLPRAPCDYPSRNLTHHWSGDGTFSDRTARFLTADGDVSFMPGVIGRSFALHEAKLTFGTHYATLNPVTISDGTIQAWVKIAPTHEESLFAATINQKPVWSLAFTNDHCKLIRSTGDSAQADILPLTGWHHIAVVRSGDSVTVFIDGATVLKTDFQFTFSGTDNHRITLGPLNGQVDEFAIHDRVMTQDEIRSGMSLVSACR